MTLSYRCPSSAPLSLHDAHQPEPEVEYIERLRIEHEGVDALTEWFTNASGLSCRAWRTM